MKAHFDVLVLISKLGKILDGFSARVQVVLSLVPAKIGYGPGKPKGPGTGRGLVSLLITPIPENSLLGTYFYAILLHWLWQKVCTGI